MKKVIVFILIWMVIFIVPTGMASWYGDRLYIEFDKKEVLCNEQEGKTLETFSESCLIENILGKAKGNRTPAQNEIVLAFEAADDFNLVLLFVVTTSLLFGGVLSWYVVYKRRCVFA